MVWWNGLHLCFRRVMANHRLAAQLHEPTHCVLLRSLLTPVCQTNHDEQSTASQVILPTARTFALTAVWDVAAKQPLCSRGRTRQQLSPSRESCMSK
mmetsp:Transcript_11496/g.16867  ORF Transcript_11496/g.16867 Transcript_11496/m.16867 type:complete len:97 (+) Transcript_11496:575-865(+)